jgi:hypothetical protein
MHIIEKGYILKNTVQLLQCTTTLNFFHSSNAALKVDVGIDDKMFVALSRSSSAISNELPSSITFRYPKGGKSAGPSLECKLDRGPG